MPVQRTPRIPFPPERPGRWLDVVVAVAAFAASLGLLAAGEHRLEPLSVVLTALTTLPLVALRRSPLAVFVICGAASVALRAVAAPAGPPLGATIALFGVAAAVEHGRRRVWMTGIPIVAVLLGHLAVVGLGDDHFPAAEALLAVLVWGGAWIIGDRVRMRRLRMAELEERAGRAERDAERERRLAVAEERMRIARDLHDSAGHAINVILVHAGLGRLRGADDPAAAQAAFATIEEVARETVGEIDQLVQALRDAGRSEADDVEPAAGLAALDGLVERRRAAGLRVTSAVRANGRPLAPRVDQSAYRIVQEALTNAARHGDGSAHVEVAVDGEELALTISNPLPRDAAAPRRDGHGIIGMRERSALLGGSLEAGARDDRFVVAARLPLSERRA